MAKSLNPFPKEFYALYVNVWPSESPPIMCHCTCNNGWYRVCRSDNSRPVFWGGKRWYELKRYVDNGDLIPMDFEPIEDIEIVNVSDLL